MNGDWKDQLKAAKKVLNPFMQDKLKNTAPREAGACTRVDSTLDMRDALKPEIDDLIRHLQKVEKWFNHYLNLKGRPLTVSTESIQNTLRSGGQSEKYALVQTWRKYGQQPGFLYESNVKNFVDVLDHVLDHGTSINAIGGAQAGKTNFESVWMLLGPAVLVLTNAAVLAGEAEKPLLYFPIISGPPHKNLGKQSQNAINNLFKMYGRMKFQAPNSSKLSSTSALNYFKQFLEIEPTFYEENTLDRSRGEAEIDLPNKFVRRATQKSMDALRTFIQDRVIYGLDAEGNARKERDLFRFEFLLIVDEAHHGAMDDEEKGNVSLFSKLMKSRLIYDNEEQTFADIVANPNTLSRVILASATNWLAENKKLAENFEEIRLPLGDDYHGPNVFNCSYIDGSKRPTKPYYNGLSELATKAQQPFFKYFSSAAYERLEAFRQMRDGIKEPQWSSMSHAEYRELSNKTLANVIRWMAIDSGDIGGDVVIRFCNDNTLTKSIASNVQPYLSDVDLKAWTGDRAGTAKEFFLEHKKTSQKPLAMLVTGRARMGDDFPRSVRHYVEHAAKIGTLNALDQGLCGRACGYGKFWKEVPANYKPEPRHELRIKEGKMEIGVGNCVWLTDTEAVLANDHVDSLANPLATGRKPHQAVKIEGLRETRNELFRQYVGVGYALGDALIAKWLDKVNDVVTAMLRHDNTDKQGKMLYATSSEVRVSGRKHYIPIFAWDFDPATYIQNSPKLLSKLTISGRTSTRIYGPKDAEDQMGKDGIPTYDLSQDGYVRASFEWDTEIDSFAVQDNDPGKFGQKDTKTAWLATGNVIGKGVRVRPRGEQARDAKIPFTELIIKVVRVDDAGLIIQGWRDMDGNVVSVEKLRELREDKISRPPSPDHWKVASIIFRCAESKAHEVSLRADIIPHKGVTKQFGAAGGE